MSAERRILIVHNPLAGMKKKIVLRNELEKLVPKGIAYDYTETEYGGHAVEIAKKAIKDGYNVVAAAGGDGTVNEIASVLTGTNVALAIIPMGSGNGLARHNRIPMNLKKAFDLLQTGTQTRIDVGYINGNAFFCAAGIGFDALVSEKFAHSTTRGLISYFLIALKEYFRYQSNTYALTIDGKAITRKSFFITFANANQFGNHAYIAPQASIDDGVLEVCLLSPFPWYKGFLLAHRLFNKTIGKSSLYESIGGRSILVTHEHPIPFHCDGETIKNQSNEIKVSVKSQALHLLKP